MNSNMRWKPSWTRYLVVMLLPPCLSIGALRANQRADDAPVAVQYHRPTGIFNVLDNLLDWLPGYTAPAHGDY